MTDLLLNIDETGSVDLVLENEQLTTQDTLEGAVLVSLFTDGRAPTDADLEPDADPRGWWGEIGLGQRMGSLAWLQDRAKLTQETLLELAQSFTDALQWLVDAEVAEDVTVTAERIDTDTIGVGVEIVRGTATRYPQVWTATAAADFSLPGLQVRLLYG